MVALLTPGAEDRVIHPKSNQDFALPAACSGLPCWLKTVENLPAMQQIQVPPLGPKEGPPEKGMATHSSVLVLFLPRI